MRQTFCSYLLCSHTSHIYYLLSSHEQAKHHCPLLTCPGNNVGLTRRIVQQFIGVLDHGVGYMLYRRLPVVKKGANVTLTILCDMIANGHLKGKSRLLLQWDGASENVNYTNIRFCVWLLSMGTSLFDFYHITTSHLCLFVYSVPVWWKTDVHQFVSTSGWTYSF